MSHEAPDNRIRLIPPFAFQMEDRTTSKSKPRKPRLEATAAYEKAHLVAHDLLDRLREALQDMPAPDDEQQPIEWGQVGDVREVNRLLGQALEQIASGGQAQR